MTTNYYYAEPSLGLVISDKSQSWTGIPEIDENLSDQLKVGQKMGQVDNLACSGIGSIQNLTIPTTENIFQNLRVRYYRDQIYTECGDQVLIILNPHKPLNIYDDLLVQYKLSKQNDKQPHIYKIAEQAKTQIFQSPLKSASLLLTGQSGAGKTVSTKHVLKYIAKESKSGTFLTQLGVDQIPIDVQITQTNILFEAFGNAQTAKNDNSSRFGKVVQIQFNNQKRIQSGRVQIHLFEKIRLTKLNYQDRNFHIFYELLAAYKNRSLLSDVEKNLKFESQSCIDFQELGNRLGNLQLDYDFIILGDIAPTDIDLQNFLALCDSLELLRFKEEEIYQIFEILAALLHLGGVKNAQDTYNPFTFASLLLRIPNLEEQFRKEEMRSVAVGKFIESASAMHGFIIHVYSQLFEWIVNRVNSQLSQGFVEQNQYILNVFDGFGFETIENEQGIQQNHLEQMIVNYTCEKLQNYFFDSIVKYEQTPYINEGIKWKKIQLDLNDTLVKFFDEVIFTNLSDCTQVGGVTDQHFLDTIKKACPLKPRGNEGRNVTQFSDLLIRDSHTNLQQSKKILTQSQIERKILGIKHSNGEVYYSMNQFLQRNKYAISEQRQSITQQSSNSVLKALPVIKYTTTLVKNAQLALKQLLQLFQSTVPFFVKCILPNNLHKPRSFDGPSVLKQLSESGIQQTAQLLTELYHFKVPMAEFFKNYSIIFKKAKENGVVQLELAKRVLQDSKEYQYIFLTDPPLLQFGTNTVFMQKAVKSLFDSQQQKLLNNFIAWGIKHFRTKIQNKNKKKAQEPQFGVIPQETQTQEQAEEVVIEQPPPTYEELLNSLKETEAQLAIFQKLYAQEIQKNQNQQESISINLLEKINGKIEILLQRSEPQQQQYDSSIQSQEY